MSTRIQVLLVLVALALTGCNSWSSRCETLCTSLFNDCSLEAWSSIEQCRLGCVEDMYRRDDASDIFTCYEAALAPPTLEAATARVNRAREAGLFESEIAAGTWDEEGEVQRALELGSCDLFAFVQCKVEAVQVVPTAPLVGN
jgi:hypothetical protein